MNNSEMKFDPMTGQPLNNVQNSQPEQNVVAQNQSQVTPTQNVNQVQMQTIPTVDQTKQEFINNTQALNKEEKEEKKGGINYVFIVILFIIIFAAIFFLFPFLLKYI